MKAKKISDTEFADDIALVTKHSKGGRGINEGGRGSIGVCGGLRMNEQKTKYLVENIHEPEGITNIGGQKVELVNDFLYLGAKIRNSEEDITTRKKKAWI